jgi:alpha-galactosidase
MKIVTVGAGSLAWGPIVNTDFLVNPRLDGAELMLMDIDPRNLGQVQRLLDRHIRERGFRKTVTATTDLREALTDADFVITAISVGGDRLWRYDAMFPQIYSIFQPVGDTIGPGGLVRALRHAGPLLNVARTMRDVSRPDAVLIQLTNPMNPICAAIEHLGGVRTYGICHGIDDTRTFVAKQFGKAVDSVRIDAAGNNHLIWCDRIEIDGEVYSQDRFHELVPTVFDTPFRQAVWERYGGIVGNYSRHPAEFLPGFVTQEHRFGEDWGFPPLAEAIDPMYGERQDLAHGRIDRALQQPEPIRWRTEARQGGLSIGDDGIVETGQSREPLDDFILSLHDGSPLEMHVNIANDGAIAGVNPAYNVELPVRFEDGRPIRRPITFNDRITAEIERVGKEQHLIGQACVAYDRDLLVDALALDALVPTRDLAARLVDEMIAFQRDYLAEYYPV